MARKQAKVDGVTMEVLPDEFEFSEASPVTKLEVRVNTNSRVVSVVIPEEVMRAAVELWLGPEGLKKTDALKAYGISFD